MRIPRIQRNWFRFNLRTLFVAVAIVCALTAWMVYTLNWIRARHEFIASEKEIQGRRGAAFTVAYTYPFQEPHRAPLMLRPFNETGYAGLYVVAVEGGTQDSAAGYLERLRQARQLFPEAEVFVVRERLVAGVAEFHGDYTGKIWRIEGPR